MKRTRDRCISSSIFFAIDIAATVQKPSTFTTLAAEILSLLAGE